MPQKSTKAGCFISSPAHLGEDLLILQSRLLQIHLNPIFGISPERLAKYLLCLGLLYGLLQKARLIRAKHTGLFPNWSLIVDLYRENVHVEKHLWNGIQRCQIL